MLKVQNSKQNQFFLAEAGDYLEAHGYTRKDSQCINSCIRFFNGDKAVVIYGDNVDFLVYNEEEPGQCNAEYSRYMAVTGIADLDMFKWMLLLHIADAVPMQQFIQAARKEVPSDVKALNDVFVTIFDHFRITENHNAVPLGY